jgi:hypothetical protein
MPREVRFAAPTGDLLGAIQALCQLSYSPRRPRLQAIRQKSTVDLRHAFYTSIRGDQRRALSTGSPRLVFLRTYCASTHRRSLRLSAPHASIWRP